MKKIIAIIDCSIPINSRNQKIVIRRVRLSDEMTVHCSALQGRHNSR